MTADAFLAAYDAVLARWPAGTEQRRVPTPYGTTHVNSCGPRDARPVVLLHGAGATSTSWFPVAAELCRTHRVHAVDLIGDPGRSVASGPRPRTVDDLTRWLDAVLDGLGIGSAALCGHSYGASIALRYTLRAPPGRVGKLVLMDPTGCFAGFGARYLLRALPMLLRPTPRRTRAFLEWETGGVTPDRDWLRLAALAAEVPSARPVTGSRPSPGALRGMTAPVLVLLSERSRAHDIRRVRARAEEVLPEVRTEILPGATHHSVPHTAPPGTGRLIAGFLGE